MNKSITAIYASGTGFSGQRFSAEILVNGLRDRGWQVLEVHTPSFDRVSEKNLRTWKFIIYGLNIMLRLLIAWGKSLSASFGTNILHLHLGQTKFSLIRDGLSLLIRRIKRNNSNAIISLQGSLFLEWDHNCLEAKLFREISKTANFITVQGLSQKDKLISLGISETKITLMDNTCLLEALSEDEVLSKQELSKSPMHKIHLHNRIKLLFLSSLIESKGYLEFIEAIAQLSMSTDIAIDATLCGKITITGEQNQFPNYEVAKVWIERQLNLINQSQFVRLCWIDGAVGEEKATLFREAQIFVLPSRYKVESQPIAVLEALASGCAVITTKIGEIPTTVTEETALLLDESSSIAIVKAIEELCKIEDKRIKLSLNGLKLFKERFAYNEHIDRWEKLFNKLEAY